MTITVDVQCEKVHHSPGEWVCEYRFTFGPQEYGARSRFFWPEDTLLSVAIRDIREWVAAAVAKYAPGLSHQTMVSILP